MLMEPLRSNRARVSHSTVRMIPPPTGGWNARDSLTDMKADEAITLDNFIPGDGGVAIRPGYASHVTGITGPVHTLMEYSSATAQKLFAANATEIYDATTAGAVGAAAVSSLTNGKWQHTMFATTGGQFLVIANGADSVRNYDGSSWTTPSITGVTSANLITVTEHVSRLWFIEKDTMKVWYLPALAIAGAATSIDFGGLSELGGELTAMATWTRDGGIGIEDFAAFITSEGEVHIYSGSDPASATTWERVGTFRIPEPIGRRCIMKAGGDVGVLTTQGLVPLSGVLSRAESAQGRVAITDKIRNAVTTAVISDLTTFGWQPFEYPRGKIILINVPSTTAAQTVQFVMNSNTGAWCRFTGIDALSWSLLDQDLYFAGSGGTIYKYDNGSSDNGTAITGIAISAFGLLGTPRTKCIRRVKPLFFGPAGYRPGVGFGFDYSEDVTFSAPQLGSGGSPWDTSPWDTSSWENLTPNKNWQGSQGEGFSVAYALSATLDGIFTHNGALVLTETGDQL